MMRNATVNLDRKVHGEDQAKLVSKVYKDWRVLQGKKA